jgi:hypothetical protein
MAVALVALVLVFGSQAAFAAPVNFLLNQGNTGTAQTTLTGSAVAGKALQITNTNTDPAATALGLTVAAGHAPFSVSSQVKVAKLNADFLDGKDSTAFLPVGGKAADANTLDGIDSTGFLAAGATAVNSDKLGGLDPSGYTRGNAIAGSGAFAIPAGGVLPIAFSGITLTPSCPSGPPTSVSLLITNTTSQPMNVFPEVGGTTSYDPLSGGGSTTLTFGPEAQTITIQWQGSTSLGVVHIAEVDRAGDCHFQYEAIQYPQ